MTTLGALLVGLLLLVVLLGVLAWMQRRPRRGPEQPRTVADLVRMREAVRPSADETEADAPAEPAAERESHPVEVPEAPVAVAEPARVEEAADPVRERPDEPEVRRARVPMSPEDAAVEAPWARAARMVESCASDEPRPVADAAPGAGRRPSLALVPSVDADARARSARRTRLASLQRSATPGQATAEPPESPQAPPNGMAERRTAHAAPTASPVGQAIAPARASAGLVDAAAVPAVVSAAGPVDAAAGPAHGSAEQPTAPASPADAAGDEQPTAPGPPSAAAAVDTSDATSAAFGGAPVDARTDPQREIGHRPGAAVTRAEPAVDSAEIAASPATRVNDADATTELADRRPEVVEPAHRTEATAPADAAAARRLSSKVCRDKRHPGPFGSRRKSVASSSEDAQEMRLPRIC